MNFNQTSTFEPLYFRPHGIDDWSGHVPFGYDLVAALRPSVIVELGAHYGQSYFSFCQAVDAFGLASRTYAVDTWGGDAHTGSYGEEVFREVSSHNQRHYASFSTLLRMSFDEALRQFPDESIELLHIDGLHTYEAVLHDFETWFPKVKPGGVILMHDTQVRSGDFGIWRIWSELETRYQSFEFRHSCGLGVLRKPGGAAPEPGGLIELLFKDGEKADGLQQLYRVCGERLVYKDQSERLQRAGQWEVLAQLYWRASGEDFTEEQSSKSYCTVTTTPEIIRIELAPGDSFEELRLDLKEAPPCFRIHNICLRASGGRVLWSLPLLYTDEELRYSGFRLTFTEDPCGLAARTGDECLMLLPIAQDSLRRIMAGSLVELEMSGLEVGDYASLLTAILETSENRVRAVEKKLSTVTKEGAALARALAEATVHA